MKFYDKGCQKNANGHVKKKINTNYCQENANLLSVCDFFCWSQIKKKLTHNRGSMDQEPQYLPFQQHLVQLPYITTSPPHPEVECDTVRVTLVEILKETCGQFQHFKPNRDISLTLTKWLLCLNLRERENSTEKCTFSTYLFGFADTCKSISALLPDVGSQLRQRCTDISAERRYEQVFTVYLQPHFVPKRITDPLINEDSVFFQTQCCGSVTQPTMHDYCF